MNNLINYSATDISRNLAYQAHYGTSFTPDKRADGVIAGYIAEMTQLETEFSQWITPENEDQMREDLERYRQTYIQKMTALLQAQSRCLSAMITGPSNFPTRRNEKANESADRRRDEYLEWQKKAYERLQRTYNPARIASAPISSDDENTIEELQAKIDKAEKHQAMMVAANKIIRRKLTDDQKVVELVKLGISQDSAQGLLLPDYMGRIGFPGYALQNNNAKIKQTKDRLTQLTKERSRDEVEDVEVNGVTISENRELNRLQLFFPGKPAVEVRDRLKANGFRWAPSAGAWQRQLNDNARTVAQKIVESL